MSIPKTPSFIEVAKMLNGLVPELNKAVKPLKPVFEGVAKNRELAKGLTNVGSRAKYIEEEFFLNKGKAGTAIKEVKAEAGKLKQAFNKIKEITDALQKGAFKKVNPKLGSIMSILLNVANAGVTIFAVKAGEEIQEIDLAREKIIQSDLQDAFSKGINNSIQIRGLGKRIDAINKKVADTSDKLYAESGSAIRNATIAREKANDALYEVRQGRVKLDARIDSLNSNFTKLNSQVAAALKGIGSNFEKEVKSTIGSIQKSLTEAQKDSKSANEKVSVLSGLLTKIQSGVTTATTTANNALAATKNIPSNISNLPATISKQLSELKTELKSSTTADIKQSEKSVKDYADKLLDGKSFVSQEQLKQDVIVPLDANTKSIKEIDKDITALEKDVSLLQQQNTSSKIQTLKAQVDTQQTSNKATLDDIKKLETRIKEQEKVNEEGNRKLDSIIPTILGIPLVIGRAEQNIIRSTPTVPQIENAAATGFCRTTQPGGCSRRMMDDVTGSINNNTNNATGNAANTILGGINAVENTAQLTLLNTINTKLGEQLPGGLSGKLERFSKWLHLDRVLNIMIWATTIHNALMLSNDIGQTLLGMIGNLLQFFGLKDSEGNSFDIGSIISSTLENLIKEMIGADNYNQLRETWAKANRIYQATTNVLNNLMNVNAVITNALEVIGSYTGRIGNALRIWGVVGEKAYSWMNPNPSFDNKWMTKLQQVQDATNTVAMVAQIPIDITTSVTEFNNSATDFVKAVKQEPDTKNGIDVGEAAKVKAEQDTSKAVSAGLSFDISDLFDGED